MTDLQWVAVGVLNLYLAKKLNIPVSRFVESRPATKVVQ